MNKALIRSYFLAGDHVPSPEDIREAARQAFAADSSNPNGPLVTTWERNDFGKWAFNLRRNGDGTPYYIHTTPENELATTSGRAFSLVQSHGCIHIRPNDRDTMIDAGYLAAGIHFEVKNYASAGPP